MFKKISGVGSKDFLLATFILMIVEYLHRYVYNILILKEVSS